MKHFLFTILFISSLAFSKEVHVRDAINLRDYYLQVYPSLFGASDYALESDFRKIYKDLPMKKKKRIKKFLKTMDKHLPQRFSRPLIYWRYIKEDKKKASEVISYIIVHKLLTLRDYIESPFSATPALALQSLRELAENQDLSANFIFKDLFNDVLHKSKIISELEDEKIYLRSLEETKLITTNLKESFPDMNTFVLDPYGLIKGNEVELLSHNKTDKSRIEWINENSIFNGGKLDFSQDFMTVNTHPAFTEDEIFIRMKEMVSRAKQSMMIDIFLFGGTMGGTFAKFAVDQALKKQEGFKLLILHDYATNYNMKDEMMPIFKYIRDRINNDPEVKKRVILLQANIQRHPPGVPFNLTGLIPKTDAVLKEIEKRNTYYESKIDHSKVIIIDANSPNPEAYFGSKNWTDHSGSYYFDNTLWVKGPAAALIQDSYMEDIQAALTEDKKELNLFFFREDSFDNQSYLPRKEEILNHFKIKRDFYPSQGNTTLRIAEANVDGRIRNVRNTLIQLIKDSKEKIFMEQLFLYDPYVVDALILKKNKSPEVSIQVMIDHNGNFGFNGFPNTIFVKSMTDVGIKVRTRKTIGVMAHFENGSTQEYHQENHRKISSFDGEVLLVGSSNINPDSLQGSFRELGAVVYDKTQTNKFDADFIKAWRDKGKTEILNIEEYQMKVGKNFVDTIWSSIINDLAATLMRSKDSIERRY